MEERRDGQVDDLKHGNRCRRVLVVDDLRDSADSLAMLLRLFGQDVATVYGGEEAIREAERFRPEVVLLDLGMPQVDGYEVCRHLRAEPWGAEVFIIALTGWGQEDDRRSVSAAGFDFHLVKPVDPDALMALLGRLPERREPG